MQWGIIHENYYHGYYRDGRRRRFNECLSHPQVAEVLSVSRKSTGMSHPKLQEYIVADFMSLQEK